MFYFTNRKIVVDILTIFFILMVAITSIIITHSYIRTKTAFLNIASNAIEQEHEATIEKLNQVLTPLPFIKMTSYLVEDGVLSLADIESLTSFMHIVLSSYPEFVSAYVVDSQGNLFLESKYNAHLAKRGIRFVEKGTVPANTAFISQIVTRNKNNSLLSMIYKDSAGKMIATEKSTLEFDARERPWYIGAKNNYNYNWIGIYKYYGTDQIGVSISAALIINNEFRGIVAADLDSDSIISYLNEISENKFVFIISDDEKIISSNDVNNSNINIPPIFSDMKDVTNPIIKKAYELHHSLNQNQFVYSVDNIEYIAHFTPFGFSNKNKQWQIVSVEPIDVLIGPIKEVNQYNTIFSAGMLLLGLILVVIASRNISRPIIRLADETKKMISLDVACEVEMTTHIYEVKVMLDAINKAKKAIHSFSKYIPGTLVEQLIDKNIVAKLGGERKDLTILFTDIANFTNLAENLDPEYLMLHLSDYLDHLTNVILLHNGNIDKYIGDAIMAFWGAPIENKDHTDDACHAILACRHAVNMLNAKWEKENKPVLRTRFGLATGEVIVGNVGSSDRLNYTVMGDTVNLAARLEAMVKHYKAEIIVSSSVYKKCKDRFLFRPLDYVKISGKKYPKTIYELMGSKSPKSPFYSTQEDILLCELTTKGFIAFKEARTDDALAIFTELQKTFPRDYLADLYIKRCQKILKR